MPPAPLPPAPARDLRRAYVEFFADRFPTHALSLSWNIWPVPFDRIRSDLRRVHARVDRKLYGPRYHRRPAAERTAYAAVLEGADHYPHVHIAWRVPPDRGAAFEALFPGTRGALWSAVVPAGTYTVACASDPTGWARYISKTIHCEYDTLILSAENPS